MLHRRSWLVAALAFVASATPVAAQQAAATRKPIDPANFDTTCAACDNFFTYANGGWVKRSTIPASLSRWGGFDELAESNRNTLKQILDEAAANRSAPAGSNTQRIGTYYRVCIDSARAEAASATPVRPILSRIDALKSTADLRTQMGTLEREA